MAFSESECLLRGQAQQRARGGDSSRATGAGEDLGTDTSTRSRDSSFRSELMGQDNAQPYSREGP